MIIPNSFTLAGMKWKVKYEEIAGEHGRTDLTKYVITIHPKYPQPIMEQTFCHELVHAIKFTMGDSGPHDEKEVDAFGYLLHQYLVTAR